MTKNNQLIIPGLKVRIKNQEVFNTVKGILDNGIYPSVFYTLMHKLTKDPDILMLSQSSTDAKISRTISGLESITEMLATMNKDQGHLKTQLTESVKVMDKMTDEIIKVRDQNKIQQETLAETLEFLSASSEGLALLKELNERSKINLSEVINRTTYGDDDTIEQINTKVAEIKDDRLVFGFTGATDLGIDEFEDSDDLLGSDFSEEEMEMIVNNFKSSEWG